VRAVCEQCGSIRIARVKATRTDAAVSMVTGREPFLCLRCGWRSRQRWTDEDLRARDPRVSDEPDPELATLDQPPQNKNRKRRTSQANARRQQDNKFDLGDFDKSGNSVASVGPEVMTSAGPHVVTARRRRSRSRRREILGTIAVSLLAMAIVTLMSFVGSCSFTPEP
jgi:hypothetical protein